VTDEEAVMRAAIDRGIPISEVKRRSALGRDIEQLENGIAAALGLER
jgi:pilus assembly protein CpaE